jgi:hypothetical protein
LSFHPAPSFCPCLGQSCITVLGITNLHYCTFHVYALSDFGS